MLRLVLTLLALVSGLTMAAPAAPARPSAVAQAPAPEVMAAQPLRLGAHPPGWRARSAQPTRIVAPTVGTTPTAVRIKGVRARE